MANAEVLTEVRTVIYTMLEILSTEMGRENFCHLGGNIADGMRVDDPNGLLQPQRARSYLQ